MQKVRLFFIIPILMLTACQHTDAMIVTEQEAKEIPVQVTPEQEASVQATPEQDVPVQITPEQEIPLSEIPFNPGPDNGLPVSCTVFITEDMLETVPLENCQVILDGGTSEEYLLYFSAPTCYPSGVQLPRDRWFQKYYEGITYYGVYSDGEEFSFVYRNDKPEEVEKEPGWCERRYWHMVS